VVQAIPGRADSHQQRPATHARELTRSRSITWCMVRSLH
jgi:hypothetical protein